MVENTNDLSEFGIREKRMAAALLNAFCDDPLTLGDNVKLEFNPNSGKVFLVDDDFNVGMMNGDKLEIWYTCPYCSHEGFLEDMKHEPKSAECTEYLEQIGAIEKKED